MRYNVNSAVLILILGTALPALASAQTRPIELGIDAVALEVDIVSAGGQSATLTTISAPVRTFRAGFFVSDQVSLEPRISFNYLKPEGTDAFTQVTLSLGTLYHFSPDLGRSRAYLRPVASIKLVDAGGGSASQMSLGFGVGVKLPIVQQLAARLEAQYAHGFANDDFANVNMISATFGFSFFTR